MKHLNLFMAVLFAWLAWLFVKVEVKGLSLLLLFSGMLFVIRARGED